MQVHTCNQVACCWIASCLLPDSSKQLECWRISLCWPSGKPATNTAFGRCIGLWVTTSIEAACNLKPVSTLSNLDMADNQCPTRLCDAWLLCTTMPNCYDTCGRVHQTLGLRCARCGRCAQLRHEVNDMEHGTRQAGFPSKMADPLCNTAKYGNAEWGARRGIVWEHGTHRGSNDPWLEGSFVQLPKAWCGK